MTTSKPTITRLATGVPGMDAVLGGGLPEYSFNILAGPPGCGKTTLAHQMMFALATPERPALYFTVLGEPPLKMLRYMQQFDFFDAGRVSKSVHFINLADQAAAGDLTKVLSAITAAVEDLQPGFVFVDSFRSVTLANADSGEGFLTLQHFVQQLGMLMTSWQATTFLIGEYFSDSDPSPVFTVADGLIWVKQSTLHNSVVRKMEILKMRGQSTIPGLHTFRIGNDGVRVFPPLRPSRKTRPSIDASQRCRMGTTGLDEMMGGGLPRGYSLLVAGPSGSGKTILAGAFISEGAAAGEKSVVIAFERGLGLLQTPNVTALLDSGMVSIIEPEGVNLSVDEVSTLLVHEIQRVGASRVVIDSLSGFELALAPTFRADFRESLSRMVSALAGTGATVLMTSELEDRYDDLRFSPYGTAFLTDAIIVQRYVEIEGRLLRVMAVVKVRASAHSSELRLFQIDGAGIRIGGRLADQEGILGGRPSRRIDRVQDSTAAEPAD
jgi:circadian clock protein KaiC